MDFFEILKGLDHAKENRLVFGDHKNNLWWNFTNIFG